MHDRHMGVKPVLCRMLLSATGPCGTLFGPMVPRCCMCGNHSHPSNAECWMQVRCLPIGSPSCSALRVLRCVIAPAGLEFLLVILFVWLCVRASSREGSRHRC